MNTETINKLNISNEYVYILSEKWTDEKGFNRELYTVGYYQNNEWHSESDWPTKEEAASRCAFLNGKSASIADGYTGVVISKSETTRQVFKHRCKNGMMDGMPFETINYPESLKYIEDKEESAATPPDVEQLRSDLVDILYECNGTGAGADDVVKYLISKGLQAGQSVVQDATPKEWKELVDIRNKLYDELPTGEIDAFDLTTVIKKHLNDLDNFVNRYRSSLSAAQEENKRLREAASNS